MNFLSVLIIGLFLSVKLAAIPGGSPTKNRRPPGMSERFGRQGEKLGILTSMTNLVRGAGGRFTKPPSPQRKGRSQSEIRHKENQPNERKEESLCNRSCPDFTPKPIVETPKTIISSNHLGEFVSYENAERIVLMDKGLASFPLKIKDAINVEDMHLCHNDITEIPDYICDLPRLTTLSLHGNLIPEIPDFLANMRNLTHLNLSDNHITKVPEELFHMRNIVELDLSENPIEEILQIEGFQIPFAKIPETKAPILQITAACMSGDNLIKLLRFLKDSSWKVEFENEEMYLPEDFEHLITGIKLNKVSFPYAPEKKCSWQRKPPSPQLPSLQPISSPPPSPRKFSSSAGGPELRYRKKAKAAGLVDAYGSRSLSAQ